MRNCIPRGIALAAARISFLLLRSDSMKKYALALLLMSTPLHAQDFGLGGREFSVDLGAGVSYGPTYPGADDHEASPWLIWRNAGFGKDPASGNRQGLSISPSLRMVGKRDESDSPILAGLGDIDRAYELGASVSYGIGPVTAHAALRKGFEGHSGITGELGVKYRSIVTDRLSLTSGLVLGYGDSDFSQTYFGISSAQAAASGHPEYNPDGGFTSAAARIEARYALTDSTAILGEIQYGRLIGDAADSPVVQDKDQPVVRLGIVRNFSFGF